MAIGLLLFIAAAAGLTWYWRTSSKPALQRQIHRRSVRAKSDTEAVQGALAKSAAMKASASHQFHAVSVQAKDDACAAAKAIGAQRFLASEAPPLPLPACDAAHCHCNYVHFSDRRENDDDRRSMYSIQTELYRQSSARDRRLKKGRRKTDGKN